MITAIELITDALRLANIIDAIQTPSAEQGVSTIRKLNQMLADWEADGIRLGWLPVSTPSQTLSLDAADEKGVTYNLAVELCGDNGIEPLPHVSKIASDTFARFSKTSAQMFTADLSGLPCEDAACGMAWPMG